MLPLSSQTSSECFGSRCERPRSDQNARCLKPIKAYRMNVQVLFCRLRHVCFIALIFSTVVISTNADKSADGSSSKVRLSCHATAVTPRLFATYRLPLRSNAIRHDRCRDQLSSGGDDHETAITTAIHKSTNWKQQGREDVTVASHHRQARTSAIDQAFRPRRESTAFHRSHRWRYLGPHGKDQTR